MDAQSETPQVLLDAALNLVREVEFDCEASDSSREAFGQQLREVQSFIACDEGWLEAVQDLAFAVHMDCEMSDASRERYGPVLCEFNEALTSYSGQIEIGEPPVAANVLTDRPYKSAERSPP